MYIHRANIYIYTYHGDLAVVGLPPDCGYAHTRHDHGYRVHTAVPEKSAIRQGATVSATQLSSRKLEVGNPRIDCTCLRKKTNIRMIQHYATKKLQK